MKKLSEIGLCFEGGLHQWDDCVKEPNISSEPVFIYTAEERRELVRGSINGWESFKLHVGFADGRLPTFEELCEEQGI